MSKQKTYIKNPKKYVSSILITILVLIIGIQSFYIVRSRMDLKYLNELPIKHLIIMAVDNLHQDLPIDAKTGNYYLAGPKLVLPPSTDNRTRLVYSYTPDMPEGDTSAELHLSSFYNISSEKVKLFSAQGMNDTFAVVPNLQACSRGYNLKFKQDKNDSDLGDLLSTKQLSDGRTIYIRKEKLCRENNDKILEYLNQIDSY